MSNMSRLYRSKSRKLQEPVIFKVVVLVERGHEKLHVGFVFMLCMHASVSTTIASTRVTGSQQQKYLGVANNKNT